VRELDDVSALPGPAAFNRMRLGRDGPSHRFQAAEQCPFAFEPRKDQTLSANDSHLIEVMTRREELFRGRFLHAFRDAVRLPDGSASDREYLVHPGAVMVIPLLFDEDGSVRLVLERQYRYPIGEVMVEFPAGKLDPGEEDKGGEEAGQGEEEDAHDADHKGDEELRPQLAAGIGQGRL